MAAASVTVILSTGRIRHSTALESSSSSQCRSVLKRRREQQSSLRRYKQRRSRRKATLLLALSVIVLSSMRLRTPRRIWSKVRYVKLYKNDDHDYYSYYATQINGMVGDY